MNAPRVLVTRAAGQAGRLSEALRAQGFEPVEVPVLEILPPGNLAPLDSALRNLSAFDWLILTSANAVSALADRAAALGLSLADQKIPKIAAVGRATASAIEALGLAVSLVPEKYVAEGLLAEFDQQGIHDFSGMKILLARAAVARDVIPDALRARGADVTIVEAYRNQMPADAPAQIQAAVEQGIEYAAFTSSSSVIHLRDAALAARLVWPLPGVHAVSIGPVTTRTLVELGWERITQANVYDIPGMVAALRSLRN
jgi:uroporphyrinogen-III synthase